MGQQGFSLCREVEKTFKKKEKLKGKLQVIDQVVQRVQWKGLKGGEEW